MIDKQVDQDNVYDGSIYIFQTYPGHGAYITCAGRDDNPIIVAFDMDDLECLANSVFKRATGEIIDPDDDGNLPVREPQKPISFSFYAEPAEIQSGRSTVVVGLGENDEGERAAVYVTDGVVGADINLTHEQAIELHEILGGIVEGMGDQ